MDNRFLNLATLNYFETLTTEGKKSEPGAARQFFEAANGCLEVVACDPVQVIG
jgi:hypothetical protein